MRLGSLVLFPEVSVEGLSTDNALVASDNEQSDHAVVVTPGLKIRSDWSRHLFKATLGRIYSSYSRFSELDDKAFHADGFARLDVTRRTNIEVTGLYYKAQEDIDATDAPADAAERTPIITTAGTVQGSHRFNRLTASLRGGITEYDYKDVPLIGGGIANNDDRD